MHLLALLVLGAASGDIAPEASACPSLIGTAAIAAVARDGSGLLGEIAPGIPADRLGSFGSAITWTGAGDEYIAVDDRGPGDGAFPFPCRFHKLHITLDQSGSVQHSLRVELIETRMLTTAGGRALIGHAGAFDSRDPFEQLRFDPEGVSLGPDGRLFISDEYGPYIDEFALDGRRKARFVLPPMFQSTRPSGNPEHELPPLVRSGRQPNRGMEGLTISPDGTRLYGILQSPLIQDGALNPANDRIGRHIRMLELDLHSGVTRQFVYVLDHPNHGVNEILAINEHEFLVLERDGRAGDKAEFRALFRIDIADATDVSKIASLPTDALPDSIHPVSKSMFLDFMDDRFALRGSTMPEKIEGMTFGPALPDGRRLLMVTSDNDFKPDVPTVFWAFAARVH